MRSPQNARPPRRAMRALLGLIFSASLLSAACRDERPRVPEAPTEARPSEEPDLVDEPDLADDDETPPPPRPVEELSEEELEAECFRGRREACDLLGH